ISMRAGSHGFGTDVIYGRRNVSTNLLYAVETGVVSTVTGGTCDPGTHAKWTRAGYAHLYMPDLPDWAIRDLGEFAEWAHAK
ncbi:hypothetical protein KBZ21_41285, partial [Streptomyces sp. A73]|nr:hypothetical protein [Streptomyces sp. A73]